MAEVRIQSLVKQFGTAIALDGVSLTVADGEVVALLGPSGCGKTTMLRCIAGLEQPTDGVIELGNETLVSPNTFVSPSHRNIAMVFQSYALWPHMTVWDNIAYGLRIQKMPKAQIQERVSEVLHLLGMGDLFRRYPSQLSGGQQQRVAVARALALRADLVLFDEPLSNLDLRLREQVRAELRRVLTELGLTAVYVTHDVGEAVVIADRIAMMSAGQIVQIGSPEEIYHRPHTRFVAEFVGNANILTARLDRGGDDARLVVGQDLGFCVKRLEGTLPASADAVQLLVRPEYVELSPGSDGAGTPATVTDVEFVGQVTGLGVKVGETELRAITLSRPGITWRPGAACRVRIVDENVVILPPV